MRPTSLRPAALIVVMLLPVVAARLTASTLEQQPNPAKQPAMAIPPPPAEQPPAAPSRETRPPAQNVNVKIDVKITDQSGSNTPVVKTLSLVLADRETGSVRSEVELPIRQPRPGNPIPSWNYDSLPLRVDLRPDLMPDGRLKVRLTLNYRIVSQSTNIEEGEPARRSEVTENAIVVLENNKPLTVSQSADATSDRKVTVELKAAILR